VLAGVRCHTSLMIGIGDADHDPVGIVEVSSEDGTGRVFRRSHGGVSFLAFVTFALLVCLPPVLGAPPSMLAGAVIFILVTCIPILICMYRFFSATVTAGPELLVARNTFRTRRVPWSEITEFEFRSYGACRVRLVSGESFGISALQQGNWRNLSNRPSPSLVRAIAELNSRVTSHVEPTALLGSPSLR